MIREKELLLKGSGRTKLEKEEKYPPPKSKGEKTLKIANEKYGLKEKQDEFIKHIGQREEDLQFYEIRAFIADKMLGTALEETAKDAIRKYHVKTTNDGDIFVFDEGKGIYTPQGSIVLQARFDELWSDLGRKNYYNEVEFKVKAKTRVDRESFNPPVNLIPLANGIYDIDTEELIEYSPEYLFTFKHPIKYDPEAECPNVDQFISDIFGEEQQLFAYELAGYCLYRAYPLQYIFLLNGIGANGKTQYILLLENMLGADTTCSVTPQDLVKHRFKVAELYNKNANLVGDIPKTGLHDVGTLKQLVGGDSLTAERKWGHPFTFKNHAKQMFSCNEIPYVTDDSYAWWRRMRIIDFPYLFVDDPENEGEKKKVLDFINTILTPEELSGFFNKSVEALKGLLKRGEFSYARSVEEERQSYLMKSNPVQLYAESRLEYSEDWLKKDVVFNDFLAWCKERQAPVCDKTKFAKRLTQYVAVETVRPKDDDDTRVTAWSGIQFKGCQG